MPLLICSMNGIMRHEAYAESRHALTRGRAQCLLGQSCCAIHMQHTEHCHINY